MQKKYYTLKLLNLTKMLLKQHFMIKPHNKSLLSNHLKHKYLTIYHMSFLKNYELTFLSVLKINNSLIVQIKSNYLNSFLTTLSSLITNVIQNKHNFYTFSNNSIFNMFWKLNLSDYFKLGKKKSSFKKIILYFLFKNKIKLLISVNFYNFKFLKFIEKLNVVKVGFVNNSSLGHYYHHYLYLPYINIQCELYLYNYILSIFLKCLHLKFNTNKHYYLLKLNNTTSV